YLSSNSFLSLFGQRRDKVKELNLRAKGLEGDLDLTEFVNLRELYCSSNQLTSLNLDGLNKLRIIDYRSNNLKSLKLNGCVNINYLDVSHNDLSEIDLSTLSGRKVVHINLNDNNLLGGNLRHFSHLINLEWLGLKETGFSGSLEPLRDC